ncbi:hypothetical protein C1H76_2001 [Elsinoe australis]|uniref:F-box domain-containing protein n=1 Tax=Elsinoe australis TaxID=40998 RepID=A0A4V6DUU3_9PEZI|nr:hypothetical protein C1H76_2001 [Elsinoe australis]
MSATNSTNSTSLAKPGPPIHPQSQSPLFHLPPELRQQIYIHLLSAPTPSTPLHPSLLATCRRLHHESSPLLYSLTFEAHPTLLTSLPYYHMRSRPVSPSLTPRIRKWHITVRLDVDARFTHEQVREAFTGCEELTVEVMQAMYGSCDFGVLGGFEGVRDVRRARVVGSLGDGRYGVWLEKRMMLGVGEEGEAWREEEEERVVRELGEGDRGKRFDRSWRLGPVVGGRDVWQWNR